MKNKNKKGAMHADQSTAKLQKPEDKPHNINSNTEYNKLSIIEPYRTIISVIGTGEENAIHLKEIIKLTKMNNRLVRKYIEDLRRSGAVIIANDKGYFFPGTDADIKKYIKQEESRAKSIFYTLKSARRYLKSLED